MNYLSSVLGSYLSSYTGLPRACLCSVLLTLLQSIAIGIIYFISLYFVSALKFDISIAGLMLSLYGAGTICGGILSGKLSDIFPSKNIAIICLLIQAFTFILLANLTNPYLLMLILFVLGLSVYGFKTANDVWMLKQCLDNPALRSKAINLSRVAMNLGLGISGIIIGASSVNGFGLIFYFFGALLSLSAWYLWFEAARLPKPIHKQDLISDSQKSSTVPNKFLLSTTLFCLFCVGLMIAQLGSTYPVYLIESFPILGMQAVSILYLLDTFLIVFTQAPLTESLNKYNKVLMMGIGAFMMGSGMLVLSLSYSFSLAIISCLIWTTGEMIFMPMAQFLCYENGGAKQKGQAMGLFQTIYAFSAVIGPAAGGYVFQHSNGNNVWYLCMLLGCLCIMPCLYLASKNSPRLYTDATPQEG